MKVQVSLDERLVERIDSFADANYMSRSGFISFATCQYLNQFDKGIVDDEMMEQLKDF